MFLFIQSAPRIISSQTCLSGLASSSCKINITLIHPIALMATPFKGFTVEIFNFLVQAILLPFHINILSHDIPRLLSLNSQYSNPTAPFAWEEENGCTKQNHHVQAEPSLSSRIITFKQTITFKQNHHVQAEPSRSSRTITF